MKRILLSLAFLALAAMPAYAANTKAPVTDFFQQQPVQAPAYRQPAPGIKGYQQYAPLHGNVQSKVFHASDCEYYNSKSATAEFANAREAQKAGYHACKICEGKEGVATAKKQQRMEQGRSGVVLHGNPTSKTLHGPSCKYYNSKSATEQFSSVEQAKRQGYKLCTVCEGK